MEGEDCWPKPLQELALGSWRSRTVILSLEQLWPMSREGARMGGQGGGGAVVCDHPRASPANASPEAARDVVDPGSRQQLPGTLEDTPTGSSEPSAPCASLNTKFQSHRPRESRGGSGAVGVADDTGTWSCYTSLFCPEITTCVV